MHKVLLNIDFKIMRFHKKKKMKKTIKKIFFFILMYYIVIIAGVNSKYNCYLSKKLDYQPLGLLYKIDFSSYE